MRKADAPRRKAGEEKPRGKRLKKGEKNGQKRMACVGGVYSVAPFCRTAEEVLQEILREEKQQERPEPQNKRLRAVLTREVDGREVNGKDVIFGWLAKEVQQRDPQERRTVVAVMDGETKLRDLQELKLQRAIGVLDIWHVTEYLWKLAYCFHREQTGMRWRIAGAQAILALRAIYVNNDWEAFHADRIQTEQRRLYPYQNRLNAILGCAA